MKTIIILLVLILVVTAFPQEISASKDTMEIGHNSFIDSVTFYNFGMDTLIVDSIQCSYTNFLLSINQSGDIGEWPLIEEFFNATNVVSIQPNDSFIVRICFAAVVSKMNQINYTKIDTIYFYNNSNNIPIFPVEITHTMVTNIEDNNKYETNFILHQNYPNPFNPLTKINYQISKRDNIKIIVYDMLGNEIVTLVDEYKNPGSYEIEFNVNNLSSGIYVYKFISSDYSKSKKMLLLK